VRLWLGILTACISGSFAMAETPDVMIDPSRIIAAATGDWDTDEAPDLALLVAPADESGDRNSVYVYINGQDKPGLTLKTVAPDKIWGNVSVWGQAPSLTALPNGSFTITTNNDSIGRDRWERNLTIAYRNFDFVVAGYTYTGRDTLNVDYSAECDFNVLTGKGTSNGKQIAAQGEIVLLKDWSDDIGRKACGEKQ
jgi:hypothetical protein